MEHKKPRRDFIYSFMLVMHLVAMIGVDFVEFYPKQDLIGPDGSLSFLTSYRRWYISTMSDPYYEIAGPGHFFYFLLYVELVIQFPFAVYLLYSMASSKLSSGAAELAGVVYGSVVGLSTLLVCYDIWYLPEALLEVAKRDVLLWQVYLPFGVAAAFMGADMYSRLLSRL